MIATDILPFSVVEGAAFKRVMTQAEPRYPLKTETFFRAKKMDEMYTGVVSKIQKLLSVENAGKSISFTTDCWSGSNEALMSLTAHFIDKNWKKVQLVLNVKSLTQSHTGQYIGETFLSMLQEWEIDVERVMLVLRDSGANMVKGMRLVEMADLSCSAHILHLVINDGLSSQRVVVDILAKRKKIATHFHHSVTAVQRQRVPLTTSEGPTTSGIQTMRKTMLNSLQKGFSKVKDSKEVALACVLDPRYKELFLWYQKCRQSENLFGRGYGDQSTRFCH